MIPTRSLRWLALLAIGLCFASCASPHQLDFTYQPPATKRVPRAGRMHLAEVVDAREAAQAGSPAVLGTMAQGEPIEVRDKRRTLGLGLERVLAKELRALGFEPVPDLRVPQLAVTVHDWSIQDDGVDASFRCDLDVAVLEPLGSRVRDRARVRYATTIEGSTGSGSWNALLSAHPEILAEVVQRCLRKNPVVLRALVL